MTSRHSTETGEGPLPHRKLQTNEDVERHIAERCLENEFGSWIAPEKMDTIRRIPDILEQPDDFAKSAKAVRLDPDETLGFSTRLEDPAHVRKVKGELSTELATLIHEDLHRLTSPETRKEVDANPKLHDLYEGVTERFTEQASRDLCGFEPGQVTPEKVEEANLLASEVGEQAVRDWYFDHEVTEDLQQALDATEQATDGGLGLDESED